MFYSKPWADALIVLLVVLLFFGPKRLPQLGKSLGEGMREFKDSITGRHKDDEEPAGISEEGSSHAAASSAPPAEPASAPVESPAARDPDSEPVATSEQRS
ncbi:MAG TPA: twin-arginine translocase TatA/TatE family subunit [Solirubrobacteraceae bacterium]|jgi:sec-independent protein translocase protein TatA